MTVSKMAVAARKENSSGPSVRAAMRPEWDLRIGDALNELLRSGDFSHTDAWHNLQELSSNTQVDAIYAISESAVYQSGRFVAPAIINVTLNYGGVSDHTSMADSFPAEIKFRISNTKSAQESPAISIEDITVDTRSFYE